MSRRQNEHQSLGKVLQDFVTVHKLQKGLDDIAVQEIWEPVMGPAIAKYTTSIQLKRQTLHVYLSSSVLRAELAYGKEKIINNINEALGKKVITKIRFQ